MPSTKASIIEECQEFLKAARADLKVQKRPSKWTAAYAKHVGALVKQLSAANAKLNSLTE